MVFARFSHLARAKDVYAPIANEIDFLNYVCVEMKSAYPGFLVTADPAGKFALSVQAHHSGAPCLVADLCETFESYGKASEEAGRQVVIEHFLSAVGNTVFNMDAPISPETFLIQLRPKAEVRPNRGEIYLPFIGDLVAALMRAGDGVMQPVTHANLDVLGLSQEQGCALGVRNISNVRKHVKQDFDANWPGLVFFSAGQSSPSGLIYRDFTRDENMPDGGYFVCDHARYVYTSARDEVAMATLVMYQRALMRQPDRLVSGSLLLRQRGKWRATDLASLANAA